MIKPVVSFTCCLFFSLFLYSQNYQRLHQKAILIDTHNDIPTTAIDKNISFDQDLKGKTHSDLQRMQQGGIDVQIFSIWCDGLKANPYAWANRQIDTVYAWAARNPGKMMMVYSPADLKKAVKQKKLATMFGVEGGHMMENNLDNLDSLYKRGVRYMTLTWNNSTTWATSAMDETAPAKPSATGDTLQQPVKRKGLTDFGKQVVKRMNALGMIVDISHVGEQTFWDAIITSTKPVIASHSCVHKLCPVFRNLKDDQLKALAKNGGVVHLNFFSGFVDSNFFKRTNAFNQAHQAERDSLLKINPEPYFSDVYLFEKYPAEVTALRPPLSMLLDHLDYIVRLIGVDHVGIGSDFDGVNSLPQQLDDVTAMPLITKELMARGYSKKDVKKILGENFIRVFKANSK